MLEIDQNNKLEITFRNNHPVALNDLSMSLLSVGHQYARFIESSTTAAYEQSPELFVKEVHTGSLVFEIVSHTMPIIPLIWAGGSLSEWVEVAKDTFDWLTGKLAAPPVEMSKPDLQQWNHIVEPVVRDNGSQLIFNVSDNGKVVNNFHFNSERGLLAQGKIRRLLEERKEPESYVYRRKVMTWYQTRFDTQSDTGDKAVIEEISKKATKVIFEKNAVKAEMLYGDPRFEKPWNELAYIVDVKVQTIGGVPKLYEIVDYHSEHTFDPAD